MKLAYSIDHIVVPSFCTSAVMYVIEDTFLYCICKMFWRLQSCLKCSYGVLFIFEYTKNRILILRVAHGVQPFNSLSREYSHCIVVICWRLAHYVQLLSANPVFWVQGTSKSPQKGDLVSGLIKFISIGRLFLKVVDWILG